MGTPFSITQRVTSWDSSSQSLPSWHPPLLAPQSFPTPSTEFPLPATLELTLLPLPPPTWLPTLPLPTLAASSTLRRRSETPTEESREDTLTATPPEFSSRFSTSLTELDSVSLTLVFPLPPPSTPSLWLLPPSTLSLLLPPPSTPSPSLPPS